MEPHLQPAQDPWPDVGYHKRDLTLLKIHVKQGLNPGYFHAPFDDDKPVPTPPFHNGHCPNAYYSSSNTMGEMLLMFTVPPDGQYVDRGPLDPYRYSQIISTSANVPWSDTETVRPASVLSFGASDSSVSDLGREDLLEDAVQGDRQDHAPRPFTIATYVEEEDRELAIENVHDSGGDIDQTDSNISRDASTAAYESERVLSEPQYDGPAETSGLLQEPMSIQQIPSSNTGIDEDNSELVPQDPQGNGERETMAYVQGQENTQSVTLSGANTIGEECGPAQEDEREIAQKPRDNQEEMSNTASKQDATASVSCSNTPKHADDPPKNEFENIGVSETALESDAKAVPSTNVVSTLSQGMPTSNQSLLALIKQSTRYHPTIIPEGQNFMSFYPTTNLQVSLLETGEEDGSVQPSNASDIDEKDALRHMYQSSSVLEQTFRVLAQEHGWPVRPDTLASDPTDHEEDGYLQGYLAHCLDRGLSKAQIIEWMSLEAEYDQFMPKWRSFLMGASAVPRQILFQEDKCDNCYETCQTLNKDTFKTCEKCKQWKYCSEQSCKKAGLSRHKKVCMGVISEPSNRNLKFMPISDGTAYFYLSMNVGEENRMKLAFKGTYLHHLPREAVFCILIDSFRLREQDNQVMDEVSPGHIQEKFKDYLNLVETRAGMQPKWWDRAARNECISRATRKRDKKGNDSAFNIMKPVSQQRVIAYYHDFTMPNKLRCIAAKVYGWSLWGLPDLS